jgi:hypothetical protein
MVASLHPDFSAAWAPRQRTSVTPSTLKLVARTERAAARQPPRATTHFPSSNRRAASRLSKPVNEIRQQTAQKPAALRAPANLHAIDPTQPSTERPDAGARSFRLTTNDAEKTVRRRVQMKSPAPALKYPRRKLIDCGLLRRRSKCVHESRAVRVAVTECRETSETPTLPGKVASLRRGVCS